MEVLIPFVNCFIVEDSDGNRLLAKYYDGRSKSEQLKFEALLHKKTKTISAKADPEVLLFDNEIVVFRSGNDCKFYVSGPSEENELILVSLLETIYESVSTLLRGQNDKRTMLDNLELVLLTIDEVLDHGHIMELDPNSVASRVLMKAPESMPTGSVGDLSISQALGLARDQIFASLVRPGRGDA